MAEQFSLFSGELKSFAAADQEKKKKGKAGADAEGEPTEAGRKRSRRGAGADKDGTRIDLDTLPVPRKVGSPLHRFGTSSWTYPGWQGRVFRDVAAYGASTRFTELSLGEYARDPRFRCAGADNMYYAAPAHRRALLTRYAELLSALPELVELCPKVWHGVTVNRYSPLQREQWRLESEINPGFLDPELFLAQVAAPLSESLGRFLGPLILELQDNDIQKTEFLKLLDTFLAGVRKSWDGRLAVELRAQSQLTPRYFDTLVANGASHVLNSWTRMPSVGYQLDRMFEGENRRYPFLLVRALLRPGIRYEDASVYAPYDRLIDRAPDVRNDILRAVRMATEACPAYVLVNNHLEGHSPATIAELQESLYGVPVEKEPPVA